MTTPLNEQAMLLSDGTLATLTGIRKYADLEEIQAAFVAFCAEHQDDFAKWQDAWFAWLNSADGQQLLKRHWQALAKD